MGKTTVLGFGRSGSAAARALYKKKKNIFISETNTEEKMSPENLAWLKEEDIPREWGGHTQLALDGSEEIIVSPGVRWDHPILVEARQRKISVVSEVEFASREIHAPIIAITGTNGKTTTTTLISTLLQNAGYRALAAGNIGYPASELIGQKIDFAVLEMSSFQLEGMQTLHPHIAILLNITPDHLDRHPSMEEYQSVKRRIYMNQNDKDFAIWNAEDKNVETCVRGIHSISVPFNAPQDSPSGARVESGKIIAWRKGREPFVFPIHHARLRGKHNADNMMASILAGLAVDIPHSILVRTLQDFPGVPHRLETVAIIEDREFINDSKATNPESSIVGIQAIADTCKGRPVLIAGGRDKGTSLSSWSRLVTQTCRSVILMGESADRFASELKNTGYQHIYFSKDLSEAIERAHDVSEPGDVILFSPACASFDMFHDYEDRGNQFRKIVLDRVNPIPHAT